MRRKRLSASDIRFPMESISTIDNVGNWTVPLTIGDSYIEHTEDPLHGTSWKRWKPGTKQKRYVRTVVVLKQGKP